MAIGYRKQSTAAMLWLFLGVTGAHKYYEGKIKQGVLYSLGLIAVLAASVLQPMLLLRGDTFLPMLMTIVKWGIGIVMAVFLILDFREYVS